MSARTERDVGQVERSLNTRHQEGSVIIAATREDVFAFVDDHARFSSHMSQSSWMMGGGRMRVELDDLGGRAVGSHIKLGGKVLGIRLFLDEVVTHRNAPTGKVWETVGTPRLLVIGSYRMGIVISGDYRRSRLKVFIDYELPRNWRTRWLGWLFSGIYATWCVRQMLSGTVSHFADRGPAGASR